MLEAFIFYVRFNEVVDDVFEVDILLFGRLFEFFQMLFGENQCNAAGSMGLGFELIWFGGCGADEQIKTCPRTAGAVFSIACGIVVFVGKRFEGFCEEGFKLRGKTFTAVAFALFFPAGIGRRIIGEEAQRGSGFDFYGAIAKEAVHPIGKSLFSHRAYML